MTCSGSALFGRWRIVEMEGWDADYIDMLSPGHLQLDDAGGHIAFGMVQLTLACSCSAIVVHFDFRGSDEGTEVSGDGDAELEPDGTLSGKIRFDNGDDMPFIARPWPISAAC